MGSEIQGRIKGMEGMMNNAYDDLIDEYLGLSLTPDEIRDIGLMQVKNASLQDDAVGNAVANLQGMEQKNRSALEEYMVAQEQQAAAEAQKAKEMAQQRLNALDQNASLLGSIVGLGKEGKRQLSAYNAERNSILKAFPELGKAGDASGSNDEPAVFDIKKLLSTKDYSPESIKRLYEENDRDAWDEAIRSGDLELFNAMNDFRLGALSDDTKNKMRYVISQRPDLSKELRINPKYSGILDLIPETQGDLKKKDNDAKVAAAKAKEKADNEELLKQYEDVMNFYGQLGSRQKRIEYAKNNPGFKYKMTALKKAHRVKPDLMDKIRQSIGDY